MVKAIHRWIAWAAVIPLLSACSGLWLMGSPEAQREGVSSSLVDYLYPRGEQPPEAATEIPRLNLPLRVGIAFVPPQRNSNTAISEAVKIDLLNKVKAAFVDREYIEHIEVIPETYLQSSKGFEGLRQVSRLYGIDVMALVSYDQVALTEDTKSSLLYWTIVGAYVIDGTKNEVQTFVDTAVFDIASRRLLFRAPGIDVRGFRSTAVESVEARREGRTGGFTAAMTNMTQNLSTELTTFEERLKSEPQLAEVTWDESKPRGGGGSMGLIAVFLLVVAVLINGSARRHFRVCSDMQRRNSPCFK